MEHFFVLFDNVIVIQAANPGLWGSFVNFLGYILTGINNITNNYGLSVVLFTILMRFVLLPLDLKGRASTKKMNDLKPELDKINQKYKNDPEKRNRKTAELYQKYGINPLGGCLPLLLQIPVFFALFAALRQIASVALGEFFMDLLNQYEPSIVPVLDQIKEVIDKSTEIKGNFADILPQLFVRSDLPIIDKMKELAGSENIDLLVNTINKISDQEVYQFLQSSNYSSFRFLWIRNIWIADSPLVSISGKPINFFSGIWNGVFILPILAGITSYYQGKLVNPSGGGEQTKGFTAIFPILSVWFTSMYTAAFGVYWITSNIFQIVQQIVYNNINKPEKEGAKREER
ncbi:MAG: YidC/Oxa1 family membrane protein insertase [Clostridiales bacterium]|nr:YidC/Oxa1 family membrane protein insertase [Clostridiales bacterium]